MAEKLVTTKNLVTELEAACERGDGYIMGATGQNPRKWKESSWWFSQYDGDPKAHAKALYWREHAQRVWDCNGMAEGIYKDVTGIDINTKARYNYAQWCGVKGTGMIPAKYRVPGAAVFWGESAGSITHVAYLVSPVDPERPGKDWYLIEAKGVMYGVVKTKLESRKPQFWGLMTKYFDYGMKTDAQPAESYILKNGCEGEAVRELQTKLIRLGYDLGKWGADGDFGDATEIAVKVFQTEKKLKADGVVGEDTWTALDAAITAADKPITSPKKVEIVGGNCYVRSAPNTSGGIIAVAFRDSVFDYGFQTTEDGWHLIDFNNQNGWVSGKYGKLVK